MLGAKSNKQASPRRARWGVMQWLILLSASACFAVLSGCAGTQKPTVPTAEPPQLVIPDNLRDGEALCLRGRLPMGDELDLEGSLNLLVAAEARAECQGDRADSLVSIGDAFNAAWRQYVNGRRD